MRKTVLCLCLLAGFATLSINHPNILAQGKKGDAAKAGSIEVSKGKDGKYRFSIRDGAGKFLANSGAHNFATEKEAVKGAEDFKAIVAHAKVTVSTKTKKK